jgi:hypothetical protein
MPIRKLRRLWLRVVRKLLRPISDWAFNRRVVAQVTGRTHVLCVGDSNVMILRGLRLPGVWLHRFGLGGATASGLENPKAARESPKIGAWPSRHILPRLARARPWQQVLFMLGNVDCSFVIWHHARESGREVQELLRLAVDGYSELLTRTLEMGFERVVAVGPPLPTMGDGWRPANARGQVTATQRERTELTLQFTAAMQERCAELGVPFIDVANEQLDPATGVIAGRFVRKELRNFHPEPEPYRELITRRLAALGWGDGATPEVAPATADAATTEHDGHAEAFEGGHAGTLR